MTTLSALASPLSRAIALALVAGLLLFGTAFAGKPGGTTTSSSFHIDNGTFASTTTAAGGTGTWAHARCYQGGVLVYEQYVKYDAAGSAVLTLGPTPSWSSGAASCTGEDGFWRNGTRWRVNATTTFSVGG